MNKLGGVAQAFCYAKPISDLVDGELISGCQHINLRSLERRRESANH